MPRGEAQREFYSGKMNERDTFGEPKRGPGFTAAWHAKATENGYLKFNDALELVREHVMQDSTNPAKPFANELRLAVIDELGVENEEDMGRVKFYSAVGTPADVFHGVDAWMEYETPDGQRLIVTLDATRNPSKDSAKADLVIPEISDPTEDEDKFLEQSSQYGKEIAQMIREREERRRAA